MGPVSVVMGDVTGAIFCWFRLRCGAKAATLLNGLGDLAHVSTAAAERNLEELLPNVCDAEQRAGGPGWSPPRLRAALCHH